MPYAMFQENHTGFSQRGDSRASRRRALDLTMVGHEQGIRACGVDSRDTCWEPIIQPQVPIRWTS